MSNTPSCVKYLFSKKNKGIALIFVIAISGVVSLIIGVMMSQYILQRHSIQSSIERIQTFYIAEAGIKKAFHYLQEDEQKGITWRTGDLIQDEPVEEQVFYERNEKAEISIIDDCGFLRIKSRAKEKFPKTIEILISGIVPEELKHNLHLFSSKPLILNAGGQLKGVIKLNKAPIFHGGSLDGMLETNASLAFPGILNESFANSIDYFRHLLSTPTKFGVELFSPQVFSPENPFPAKKVFINDVVLIENKNFDSLWHAGNDLIIASTAEVQISGSTKMSNITITAVGTVKILDKAELRSSTIYSESGIELREEARFSGVLIGPDIKISEQAQVLNPSTVYCGSPFKSSKMIFNNELLAYCSVINLCSGKNSLIEISECAKIEGFIYSKAPITHRGEISGYVYCRGFFDEPVTQDTTNHNVLSGIIKPVYSSGSFSIPIVFQNIKDFQIIRWQEF